ncbi:GntR family transcriptional regulator [Aquimarina agarivorans]|uniref:GntR family transcriptional regulator n=1 Tax=Aquimarina agarivorans TaxID=980584 RepID=UPI000248EA67|nr:GntR family transcriptional regulator [Aquimarina agarivorans]
MSAAFKKNTSIYIQIAESICDKLLLNEFKEEEKIPSIRDMAVKLEVNPNTVQRSYEWLQQHEIIYTKRGRGYFVMEKATQKVMEMKRIQFVEEVLPDVFKNMELLQIDINQFEEKYSNYLNNKTNEN